MDEGLMSKKGKLTQTGFTYVSDTEKN